jgi:hypothetical protein
MVFVRFLIQSAFQRHSALTLRKLADRLMGCAPVPQCLRTPNLPADRSIKRLAGRQRRAFNRNVHDHVPLPACVLDLGSSPFFVVKLTRMLAEEDIRR